MRVDLICDRPLAKTITIGQTLDDIRPLSRKYHWSRTSGYTGGYLFRDHPPAKTTGQTPDDIRVAIFFVTTFSQKPQAIRVAIFFVTTCSQRPLMKYL